MELRLGKVRFTVAIQHNFATEVQDMYLSLDAVTGKVQCSPTVSKNFPRHGQRKYRKWD